MNIAEGRTVVVEMVKRLYSLLQVLGGVGVFREQRRWTAAPGQPAQQRQEAWPRVQGLGLGCRLQPRSGSLPSVTGSVSWRSRHRAIFRTCRWEGCVFGLTVLALVLLCLQNRVICKEA